jgi:hypothetical protein
MQYDFQMAVELGTMFFNFGIPRKDAAKMIERIAFNKYIKSRPAEKAFRERAERAYDRWLEVEPSDFGRLKS